MGLFIKSKHNNVIKYWKRLVDSKKERAKTGCVVINNLQTVANELPGGLNVHSVGLVLAESSFAKFQNMANEDLITGIKSLPSFHRTVKTGSPISLMPSAKVMGITNDLASHIFSIDSSSTGFQKLKLGRSKSDSLLINDMLLEIDLPCSFFGPLKRLVVCPKIKEPGNLGTILRLTGAIPEWQGLFCVDGWGADIAHPKAIRASKGAFLRTPFQQSDFESLAYLLQKNKMLMLFADSQPRNRGARCFSHGRLEFYAMRDGIKAVNSYSELLQKPIALFLGSESGELSDIQKRLFPLLSDDYLSRHSPLAVKIALKSRVDSLNVSNAAAILLYSLSL